MQMKLVSPEAIDSIFLWPLGKAERLARRGLLPHYILPDGHTVRFDGDEIGALVNRGNFKNASVSWEKLKK
ncbi:MAG: hypothetical protein WCT04_21205 [Planctomycetota bacterium]